MKRLVILCLPLLLLLVSCNTCEKENNRLKDEVKLLREENNYLKAEIIGMKKELEDLAGRQKEDAGAASAPGDAADAQKKAQALPQKKDQPQNGQGRTDKAKPKSETPQPYKRQQPPI